MRAWRIAVLTALAVATTGCSDAPAAVENDDGKADYVDYCLPCHAADGSGNAGVGAPSIAGLPDWYVAAELHKFREGSRGTHFDDINGMKMRPMALALTREDQMTNLAQYVSVMPVARPEPTLQGGDPEKGKATFGTCQACHQADAHGSPALGAPALTKQPDWYLLTQLKNFKAGVRGKKPLDKTGQTMAPMAKTLADEQAMKDVIAYVQTLPK